MKKNGFTLVELLAAIGIIGMLATLLIPTIVKRVNEAKEDSYQTLLESIELSAQDYVINKGDSLSDYQKNDWINIPLSTLLEEDYFEDELIDPRTNESLPINNTVYVTRTNTGNVEAYYDENQNTNPKITLNGAFNLYVKKGTSFTDPGVVALNASGTDVSSNVITTGGVDTSSIGIYQIKYTYENISKTRNIVIYEGTEIPIFTYITLTINPDGGIYEGSSEEIIKKFSINSSEILSTPEKEGYVFIGWEITGTGSGINGSTVTLGEESATVIAKWRENALLAANLDGGTSSQTFDVRYSNGEKITLETPTKEGYAFTEWTVSDTDATIKDNILTMGIENVTVIANWVKVEDLNTEFAYTGDYQTYEVLASGYYKVELWGASGGAYSTYLEGYGAYTSGTTYLKKGEKIYVTVGGAGKEADASATITTGGYNGGGSAYYSAGTGGGATDIRYGANTINDRIMVAGGGGGTGVYNANEIGGNAGGLTGYDGGDNSTDYAGGGHGGTQISGGTLGKTATTAGTVGSFGSGGTGGYAESYSQGSGAGGAGYYGGAGGSGRNGGGAGGSSFISGHTGCVAIVSETDTTARTGTNDAACDTSTTDNLCSVHYSNKVFTDTTMIDGSGILWEEVSLGINNTKLMPNPEGGSYTRGVGHTGNGYAKITFVSQ